MLKDDTEILQGNRCEGGLYCIKGNNYTEGQEALLVIKKTKIQDWHRKLGHLSYKNMTELLGKVTELDYTKKEINTQNLTCAICAESKQARIPFGESRKGAKRPLEIVHTDICGPVEPTVSSRVLNEPD